MSTVAGIFNTRADAERAAEQLRTMGGLSEDNVSLLSPGSSKEDMEEAVATTETEQPGMGTALGGVVGGAMGVAGGATMGAAAASLLVPGVGPVLAAGIIGAALLGAGGATAGAVAGDALEDAVAPGLPHDELYVYEDALRQGKTVVIAVAGDEYDDGARSILAQNGAESIDAARESWWVGLRSAEEEEYTGQGKDFAQDEPLYRHGFESALHPQARGRSYADNLETLRARYGEECEHDAFKCGHDRGQDYQRRLQERYKS